MKLYKKLILSFIFFFLFRQASMASHASGGQIVYRCLGNNTYEIIMTFYRDCFGIAASSTKTIDISDSCGYNLPGIVLNAVASSPTQISNVCPQDSTTCNGGSYTGIEEWVYVGVVTLPGPCSVWTFSHTEVARSSALTTITGAGSDALYTYAMLNNTNGVCNNSPYFSLPPVFNICTQQEFCFGTNAIETDGDSLSYEMIAPLKGADSSVTYSSGYSVSQPVISVPPVSFDPSSGTICMTPTMQDVTPIAVLINEYRDGQLIGQVERDIQLNVLNCNNIFPSLSGIDGTFVHDVTLCAGIESCFYIASSDPDSSNTTQIDYLNALPGAIFHNSSGYRDTIFICWTPSFIDTLNNPHCINVTVFDDNCPYYGSQTNAYCFYVADTPGNCFVLSSESSHAEKGLLKLFPQPANDHLYINIGDNYNTKEIYQLQLINIFGKIEYESNIEGRITSFDVKPWSAGIHFIIITDHNGRIFNKEKLIVNH